MSYLGDILAGQVLNTKFSTFTSTPGILGTLGGGAVSVYKANSLTESISGVTLTADFDSITGLNNVRIDTSADGTFYSAGSDFQIVLTAGTIIGGHAVAGTVIGEFSIANRSGSAASDASANADALLDRADGIESGWTPRQALQIILAALAGKLSGAATNTAVVRDVGDTKNRITATVDSDGNRSAVSYDKT